MRPRPYLESLWRSPDPLIGWRGKPNRYSTRRPWLSCPPWFLTPPSFTRFGASAPSCVICHQQLAPDGRENSPVKVKLPVGLRAFLPVPNDAEWPWAPLTGGCSVGGCKQLQMIATHIPVYRRPSCHCDDTWQLQLKQWSVDFLSHTPIADALRCLLFLCSVSGNSPFTITVLSALYRIEFFLRGLIETIGRKCR